MPNLICLTLNVNKRSPTVFVQLLRRLVLPDGAKKKKRALAPEFVAQPGDLESLRTGSTLTCERSSFSKTANGLRHVQLSGGFLKRSFRLWTGDLGHEKAEFSFEFTSPVRSPSPKLFFPLSRLLTTNPATGCQYKAKHVFAPGSGSNQGQLVSVRER